MRRFIVTLVSMFAFAALAAGPATAADRGSQQDAVALVKKAIKYLKANGKEKAFAEFSNPKGEFIDRDLYIVAFSTNGDGVALAHGGNAKLVGRSLIELRDADGKYMVKEFLRVANDGNGTGWVDYKWPHPQSGSIEAKSTYIERAGDVAIACGVYK